MRKSALMLAVAIALVAPAGVRADAPTGAVLTGLRSWAAVTGTRLVFDFNAPVTPVAPDSGASRQLVVSVPVPGLTPGEGVPMSLSVRDSSVDSVRVSIDAAGARFILWLQPGTRFHVFTLPAYEGRPFRVVVDVVRAAAAAAEDQRLTSIAKAKRLGRTRLVVIDAGHGGDDVGARGPGPVYEKNVTLAVARKLAEELNAIPGVQTLLTRDSDFFIPLRGRYRIAEKARADLFISIHCNSSRRRGAGSGTEVYFLSLKGATDQADADLADIENAADIVGGVPSQAEDNVVSVLYDVKRNSMLERSQLLAETLVDHISADRRVESRGIKQAGFVVLKSVEFPSVLVETAFINNPREVKLLNSPSFQTDMAKQLATGVKEYFIRSGVQLGGAPADSGKGAAGTVGTVIGGGGR
ncbi:MAG: N-acetylmuramoyl-L-alanine amidase [Candidatus Eisenbacteria bacterium]